MRKFSLILFVALAIASSTLGCEEEATQNDIQNSAKKGTLKVNIYGQEFVEDKIPHESQDGYHGQGYEYIFENFEVEIKDVKAHPEQGGPIDILTETKRVNLKPETPTNGEGVELISKEVPVGKYHLSFTIGKLHIQGYLQKPGGTEKKTFNWTIDSETKYTECKNAKGGKGIREVTEGQTGTYQITIHADHVLSAKLKDKSAEPQWKIFSKQIVDADTNADNEITKEELTKISLPAAEYDSSADTLSLWGVMEKHAKIVGHVNGNGHCTSK